MSLVTKKHWSHHRSHLRYIPMQEPETYSLTINRHLCIITTPLLTTATTALFSHVFFRLCNIDFTSRKKKQKRGGRVKLLVKLLVKVSRGEKTMQQCHLVLGCGPVGFQCIQEMIAPVQPFSRTRDHHSVVACHHIREMSIHKKRKDKLKRAFKSVNEGICFVLN